MAKRLSDPYNDAEWQRLFMEQRSHMARAGIHAALLLNGGAAVALLAFVGQLVSVTEASAIRVEFGFVRWAFASFGAGVFLATTTYIFTYFINSLRIHDTMLKAQPSAQTIDRLRWYAIFVFLASLSLFLIGMILAVASLKVK